MRKVNLFMGLVLVLLCSCKGQGPAKAKFDWVRTEGALKQFAVKNGGTYFLARASGERRKQFWIILPCESPSHSALESSIKDAYKALGAHLTQLSSDPQPIFDDKTREFAGQTGGPYMRYETWGWLDGTVVQITGKSMYRHDPPSDDYRIIDEQSKDTEQNKCTWLCINIINQQEVAAGAAGRATDL